ncbi:MAG TPA: FGGY-family carbohydrate kinase, partial [Thermomicrobiales bacterium]|nr:FGGY-family carbohydrate kinase [Thermomicrobiales bacterium]
LARTRPETFARVAHWTSFAEYAALRLAPTAGLRVSISMASGAGLLDVHRLDWDEEALAMAGIARATLSPLVDAGDGAPLGEAFARRWPALAHAPWFPALGDGACANVGSGAIGPGRIALTLGTSGAMRLVLPAPPGAVWRVPPDLWAYRLDHDCAVLGGALSNGGNLLAWLRQLLAIAPDSATVAAAAALEPDAHGLTFLPVVAGERSPAWHDEANGIIAGLTLATRPEDLLRAAMEAVAYRFARIYDALRPLATEPHQIVANGGAILNSPAWLQITADALGHPLIALPPSDEASARGAALMAAVAAGLLPDLAAAPDPAAGCPAYAPAPARTERYRAGRLRQERLEALLFPAASAASAGARP